MLAFMASAEDSACCNLAAFTIGPTLVDDQIRDIGERLLVPHDVSHPSEALGVLIEEAQIRGVILSSEEAGGRNPSRAFKDSEEGGH